MNLRFSACLIFVASGLTTLIWTSWCGAEPKDTPPGKSVTANQDSGQQDRGSYSPSKIEAERQQIWNSQEMLEARAWLEDHFRRSAQISDAQAKKYMAELKAMSPDQMRIWLINFNRQHSQMVQEGQSWRNANRTVVDQRRVTHQIGGFSNPYSGQGRGSAGFAAANNRRNFGNQASAMAPRPTVQKPFSSAHYQRSIRPLVTSEDVARAEILRGLGPWGGW